MHALGEAAADALSRMIDDPDAAPVRRFVPTRLVVRSSSGGKRAPRETGARDHEGGALAKSAAALTEPPAAGQSIQNA
jgi:hypothetical protein